MYYTYYYAAPAVVADRAQRCMCRHTTVLLQTITLSIIVRPLLCTVYWTTTTVLYSILRCTYFLLIYFLLYCQGEGDQIRQYVKICRSYLYLFHLYMRGVRKNVSGGQAVRCCSVHFGGKGRFSMYETGSRSWGSVDTGLDATPKNERKMSISWMMRLYTARITRILHAIVQ